MAIDPSAVWDFAGEIVGRIVPPRATTTATVTRIGADGTVWVTTGDGGEAPASSVAAGVSVGDTVSLEWDGASMGIRGNVSNPSPAGSVVRRAVARAQGVADAAQRVADAVNQHFWHDDNGAHVTMATQDEWEQSHSGPNSLWNSLGMLFRDGLNNLLTLTTESGARALTIWDGLGNTAEHVVATFAGDGIGLAGDAFHLTSRKTGSSGTENIVSNIEMTSTNSSYGVRSLIYSDTSISSQWQGLSGYMGMSLAVGDSTFDNIAANPTLYMFATYNSSGLVASADNVNLIADEQIQVEADECVLRLSNGTSNTWSTAAGTVLWSASSGWQMAANVTATFNYNVSTCPSGIVLHWQAYANSATQDYDHVYTFIPKQHVVVSSGKGVVCQLANSNFGYVGTKYVYVANGGITGHANNQSTGTANGITYANNHWVLTQVIAV